MNAPAFTGSWSTARQPRTGHEPLNLVPVRAGRSGRPLPLTDTGRSSASGASGRPCGRLRSSRVRAASPAQKIPRYLLRVSGGRLPGELNPASRGPSHPVHGPGSVIIATTGNEPLTCNATEPPIGIEPMTYALREACSQALRPLPAPMQHRSAPTAPKTLGLSAPPFHEPAQLISSICTVSLGIGLIMAD